MCASIGCRKEYMSVACNFIFVVSTLCDGIAFAIQGSGGASANEIDSWIAARSGFIHFGGETMLIFVKA